MIFAEAYAALRELHAITDAAATRDADLTALAHRLEPLAARIAQGSGGSDCALLWWPSDYADYFTAGFESAATLGALLQANRGPVVWVREDDKLSALPKEAEAFVRDALLALTTAGRVIVVTPADAGLAGGLCAGVVTANLALADAFRNWGRAALTEAVEVPEFVDGLVAPDLDTEVAIALDAAAKALESAFQRVALTLG